jgi:hypothetical protein
MRDESNSVESWGRILSSIFKEKELNIFNPFLILAKDFFVLIITLKADSHKSYLIIPTLFILLYDLCIFIHSTYTWSTPEGPKI